GPGGGQLVQSRDQDLGDIAAAVDPEALFDHGRAHATTPGSTEALWALSMNLAIRAWSLTPGWPSTPLATSTAKGRAAATPSPTFSGVKPPARIRGTSERRPASSAQSKLSPVPPGVPGWCASSRWKSVR